MEGIENPVLWENLKLRESLKSYFRDTLGSNEFSLFIDSYLAASLRLTFSVKLVSISVKTAFEVR